MILILSLVLVFVFGYFCVLSLSHYVNYRKYLHKYPGPRCYPIIGNTFHFARGTGLIPSLMKCKKKYGDIVHCMLPFSQRLFLTGAKPVETLLSSTTLLEKPLIYKFFHPWLGLGLLTGSGARWKHIRKLLTPAFHFKILKQFIDIFDKQGNILINILEKCDGKEVDVFPYIALCSLDIICEATMNTSVDAQFAPNSEYVSSVHEMCAIVFRRYHSPLKAWDALYKLSKDYQKQKKALTILHGYSNAVIKRRKKELEDAKLHISNKEDEMGNKHRLVFLDLLLLSEVDGKPLPHNVIREEVDTFMFEGHDTTTSGISFTLYCLSKNPEVQDKVFTELKVIDPQGRKAWAYDDLQQMKYLEQVIKESLRLYPPVPLFARTPTENVDFGGTLVPKGISLTVFTYGLHRCPKLYPNPDVFDPERFTPENSRARSIYGYVPFSTGSRNCIGQRFAMLEIKSIVAYLIREFKLLEVVGHEPELTVDAILRPQNGLPIRFVKRNNNIKM
ncbi:cytochrome P450 4C1-like isoform X1 [Photinus pyralis]|uniref:cytochrome P450 4C1-like isoform X1 n=1 Tax=Photinus pyralis TaxID=7054 RepID=UPI0012675E96|nr:cytochrome P450 4C1-like isoform X1 [Photinus pyralis]